jgi:hypothetical protein
MRNFQRRSNDKRQQVSSEARRKMSESKLGNTNALGREVSTQIREHLRRLWNDKPHKQIRAAIRAKRLCGFCGFRACLKHVPVKHLVTGKTYHLLVLPASLQRRFLDPEECRMRTHRAMHRQITEYVLKFRAR